MTMYENWRYANESHEVEHATAERIGWHMREAELAREERAKRLERRARQVRAVGWIARVWASSVSMRVRRGAASGSR